MRVASLVAVALLLVGAIAALVVLGQVRDGDERSMSEGARRLAELDGQLDEAILESQSGLALSYDEVAARLRAMTAGQQDIERAASAVGDETLAAAVAAAHAHLLERERLVEAFESKNSVFRNSLTFLPAAAKRATSVAPAGPAGDRARGALANLLEDVLRCRDECGQDALAEIHQDIAALERSTDALTMADRASIDVVLEHARTFLRYAPALHDAVRTLVRMDGHAYGQIAKTVAERSHRALRSASVYKSVLVAVSAVLLLAVAAMIRRLRTMNLYLESRIEQRTSDLSASRDQYRLLVETAQAIPFEMDPASTCFTYIAPQATVLLGYAGEEWTRDGFFADHVHPDDRANALAGFADATDQGEIEFRIVASDGRWVWLRALVSASLGADAQRRRRGVFLDSTDRRSLEASLRAAQKLESVGRLASGIAHEINTPIQFVSDNVRFVSDATSTLSALLAKYRATCRTPDLEEADAAADLEYLLDEVPRALAASEEGLSRVAHIVRAMKGFAHPDRREKTSADLNQNIQNTLLVARSEYASIAELVTDLGELPPIECHAGEINQVVLNLVTNAAHSIANVVGTTGRLGKISVRSWREARDVVFSVSDTGSGISPEHQERLFEPFFTTKDVGVGTGQGLAIARSLIVDKHGGAITCISDVGRGTEFRVRLPIDGKRLAASAAS